MRVRYFDHILSETVNQHRMHIPDGIDEITAVVFPLRPGIGAFPIMLCHFHDILNVKHRIDVGLSSAIGIIVVVARIPFRHPVSYLSDILRTEGIGYNPIQVGSKLGDFINSVVQECRIVRGRFTVAGILMDYQKVRNGALCRRCHQRIIGPVSLVPAPGLKTMIGFNIGADFNAGIDGFHSQIEVGEIIAVIGAADAFKITRLPGPSGFIAYLPVLGRWCAGTLVSNPGNCCGNRFLMRMLDTIPDTRKIDNGLECWMHRFARLAEQVQQVKGLTVTDNPCFGFIRTFHVTPQIGIAPGTAAPSHIFPTGCFQQVIEGRIASILSPVPGRQVSPVHCHWNGANRRGAIDCDRQICGKKRRLNQ